MSEVEKKKYTFDEFADLISQRINYDKEMIISISGPSCVGKSTLANILMEKIQNTVTIQVICIDNYLKSRYRGMFGFRNNENSILEPNVFDWEMLKRHLQNLKQGQKVIHDIYIRGMGWGQKGCLKPSKILILEGLFLDSVQAYNHINSNFLIEMNACDEFIKNSRLQRDEYYRKKFQNFYRNESDSLKEINNTIVSNKIYKRAEKNNRYMQILVIKNFLIEILECSLS